MNFVIIQENKAENEFMMENEFVMLDELFLAFQINFHHKYFHNL